MRAQACVQHWLAAAQLEVEDTLHRTSAVRGGLGGMHALQSAPRPVAGSPTWHKCFVQLSSTGVSWAFPAVATSNDSRELAMTTTSPPMATKITTGYYGSQERAMRTSAEPRTSCFVPTSDHGHKGVSPRMSPASLFLQQHSQSMALDRPQSSARWQCPPQLSMKGNRTSPHNSAELTGHFQTAFVTHTQPRS